jgi:quercetin dioxygenase-like cupin family protein
MHRFFLLLTTTVFATFTIAIPRSLSEAVQKENPEASCAASIPTDKGALMRSFDDLKWAVLPDNPRMEFAPLTGNQMGGPYTQMRRVRAATDMPQHIHSVEITDVVISGKWYAGADMASAKDFGPGSVIVIPANWPHVSGCRAGSDCVFYHEGKGKFDFKPVRPSILDKKSGD